MNKVKTARNGRKYVVTSEGARFISDAQAARMRGTSKGKTKKRGTKKRKSSRKSSRR